MSDQSLMAGVSPQYRSGATRREAGGKMDGMSSESRVPLSILDLAIVEQDRKILSMWDSMAEIVANEMAPTIRERSGAGYSVPS
jgi:hypothetical protein